jgi:hypothetical protein
VQAQPAQGLELPEPRRAGEQIGTERHAARCGPLQLAHRDERRTDRRREPRARLAPFGARDCRSQLAARERRGELVVLGQLRRDGHEQFRWQIEQPAEQLGRRLILGHPAAVAVVVRGRRHGCLTSLGVCC